MRILLLKKDQVVREVVTFVLESQFDSTVLPAVSLPEAFNVLFDDAEVNLIICSDDEDGLKLLKYLASVESTIPCIVIRPPDGARAILFFTNQILSTVSSLNLVDELKQVVTDFLKQGAASSAACSNTYCRIQTQLLTRVSPLKGDVYIRLSGIKFVRLFKEGDVFEVSDLQKFLVQKQIDYLYLRKEDTTEFITKLKGDLQAQYSTGKVTPEVASSMAYSVHETVHELGRLLGFTPEVQELARQGIRFALSGIGSNPRLAEIIRSRAHESGKYVTAHSIALAEIACGIAASLNWPSGTTFTKLTFAAFFHDITFTNQKLAQIHGLDELESKKGLFSADDIDHYKQHPQAAAAMIREFTEIPSDADTIILQHHERPDGSGFPRKTTASYLLPLSCVFIIAHDLLDYILDKGRAGQIDVFFNEYQKKYMVGHFRKIFETVKMQTTAEANTSLKKN